MEWISISRAGSRRWAARLFVADSLSALALAAPNRPRLALTMRPCSRRSESSPIAAALGAALSTALAALLWISSKWLLNSGKLRSINPVSRRLALASSVGNETSLAAKQLKLLGVFLTWLE